MRTRSWKLVRDRVAMMLAVLAVVGAVALQAAASTTEPAGVTISAAPSGPSPAADVAMTASPVVGLEGGDVVTYRVTTTGAAKLFGVTAHLCRTGFTGYNDANYGYADDSADRCVDFTPTTIVSDTMTAGTTFEQHMAFSGSESDSGDLTFTAGTGAITWVNDLSHGPFTLTCGGSSACDLVVKVSLTGSPATTFFIQTLTFAGGGGETTTTLDSPTSTSSSTTSPSSTSSTTTTSPGSTSSTTSTTTTTTAGGTLDKASVAAGGTVTVSSSGWLAGASVTATLHSTPVALGTPVASSAGQLQATFTIPTSVAAGAHTLELTGAGANGEPRTVSLPLTVTAVNVAGQLAFTGAVIRDVGSAALLVLGVGLFAMGRHYRRRALEP